VFQGIQEALGMKCGEKLLVVFYGMQALRIERGAADVQCVHQPNRPSRMGPGTTSCRALLCLLPLRRPAQGKCPLTDTVPV
jgi:hypothetical protein